MLSSRDWRQCVVRSLVTDLIGPCLVGAVFPSIPMQIPIIRQRPQSTIHPALQRLKAFPSQTFCVRMRSFVVIFVSDENDCSYPAQNPIETGRPICRGWSKNYVREVDRNGNEDIAVRYVPPADNNGDMLPDTFDDPVLCNNLDATTCYTQECTEAGQLLRPEDCYRRRCVVDVSVNSNCEWQRDRLTPVNEYYQFLTSLKGQPLEQLVVATIVGQRRFTPNGFALSFDNAPPSEIGPTCSEDYGDDLMNRPEYPINLDALRGDMCCPEGRCKGNPRISCVSNANGGAFAGSRYIDLASLFEDNGIGCPTLTPATATPAMLGGCAGRGLDETCQWACEEGEMCEGKCRPVEGVPNQLACSACLSICEDDFEKPLIAIKTKVAEILATYCLEKTPQCVVANEEGSYACRTPDELADRSNYLSQIRLRQECALTVEQGGSVNRFSRRASWPPQNGN